MARYRIVRDNYLGYEARFKVWWWPFWVQCFRTNTSRTQGDAMQIVEKHQKKIVWESRSGRTK